MDIDVFVSHHTDSSINIVKAIVNQLESCGVRCWYAPRDTVDVYSSSIVKAISKCKIFLLILNKPASESEHVLIRLDNMYETYNIRPELLKSRQFYNNAFDTSVNYEDLMALKKELN